MTTDNKINEDNPEQEQELNKEESSPKENKDSGDSEAEENSELIESLQEQIDSLQDKLLRSMAECENVRARSAKMTEEAREYAITSFAKDLMLVKDNLSMALQHVPEDMDKDVKVIIDGVMMTNNELENVFNKHGMELIEPKPGDKFDYNTHNAISQIVTKEFSAGNVVNTMQVGYKIKDRLLRPAAVTVAKK